MSLADRAAWKAAVAMLTARVELLEQKHAELVELLERDYARKRGPRPDQVRQENGTSAN